MDHENADGNVWKMLLGSVSQQSSHVVLRTTLLTFCFRSINETFDDDWFKTVSNNEHASRQSDVETAQVAPEMYAHRRTDTEYYSVKQRFVRALGESEDNANY